MNTRLQDKIDQYHTGRMSSKEASSFEKELASDPSLQAESDFQSDIIDGLKEYRRAELKARLSAVDVSPVWYDFVQQSTLLKSFGGVAVATLVGTGVFLLAEPKVESVDTEVVVDSPKEILATFAWNIEPASLSELKIAKVVEQADKQNVSPQDNLAIEETSSETVALIDEDDETTPSFAPNFNAPDAEEVKDEEAMEVSSLDKLPENAVTTSANEPIEVDYESKKTLNFQGL